MSSIEECVESGAGAALGATFQNTAGDSNFETFRFAVGVPREAAKEAAGAIPRAVRKAAAALARKMGLIAHSLDLMGLSAGGHGPLAVVSAPFVGSLGKSSPLEAATALGRKVQALLPWPVSLHPAHSAMAVAEICEALRLKTELSSGLPSGSRPGAKML